MSVPFFENLYDSLGTPKIHSDPNRLGGLVQYARERLRQPEAQAQVKRYIARMRFRIQATWRARQGQYEVHGHHFPPAIRECIEENLSACSELDGALDDYLRGQLDHGLERLEQATRDFLDSSERLASLTRGSQPQRPRAGWANNERLSPTCHLGAISLFPIESEDQELNQGFAAVFRDYLASLENRCPIDTRNPYRERLSVAEGWSSLSQSACSLSQLLQS